MEIDPTRLSIDFRATAGCALADNFVGDTPQDFGLPFCGPGKPHAPGGILFEGDDGHDVVTAELPTHRDAAAGLVIRDGAASSLLIDGDTPILRPAGRAGRCGGAFHG